MKISAILITQNDQANIDPCLESLKWVDEIVCIDRMSTDRTVEKLKERGVHYKSSDDLDVISLKNEAVDKCKGNWILHVEPNERVPSALARELTKKIDRSKERSAYAVKMDTAFFEKKLSFSGTQNDYRIKFWPKGDGMFVPGQKDVKTELPIKTVKQSMIIYDVQNERHYAQFREKNLESDVVELRRQRGEVRFDEYTLRPILVFLNIYFLKLGFLDGLNGVRHAYYRADYEFLKFYRFKKVLDEEMLGGNEKLCR